jgi:cob(I)alamin adenosyltransferase
MIISKVYTRTGDDGTTALIGGERVSKASLRVECYGTIDELNAFIGRLKVVAKTPFLTGVQKLLFELGAELANPNAKEWNGEEHIKELEAEIDRINADLEFLREFTVPGEDEANAEAHICRTVCRRAERVLCAAKENGVAISDSIITYVNRLSDYFFVLSRI